MERRYVVLWDDGSELIPSRATFSTEADARRYAERVQQEGVKIKVRAICFLEFPKETENAG